VASSWLAVRSALRSVPRIFGWRLVARGGLLAGIGFTMALFIANLAFRPKLIGQATLGIFARISRVCGSRPPTVRRVASCSSLPSGPRLTRSRHVRPAVAIRARSSHAM
jgi:hypothetical protein